MQLGGGAGGCPPCMYDMFDGVFSLLISGCHRTELDARTRGALPGTTLTCLLRLPSHNNVRHELQR